MFRRFRLIALALPIVAGCYTNETLDAPDLSNNNGLFTRFVAIGTSISAGLQSAGINDSTQQRSFQVLVAEQAGRQLLPAQPEHAGLPRAVRQQRDAGACRRRHRAPPCTLRQTPIPHNVGQPRGAGAHDTRPLHQRRVADQHLRAAAGLLPRRPDAVERGEGGAAHAPQHRDRLVRRDRRRVVPPRSGRPRLHHPLPGVRGELHPVRGQRGDAEHQGRGIHHPGRDPDPVHVAGQHLLVPQDRRCAPACRFSSRPTSRSDNNCAPNAAIPGSKGDSVLVPWTIGVAGLLRASSPPFTPFTLDCSNTDSGGDAGGVCVRAHHHRADEPAHPRPGYPHGWALVEAGDMFATAAGQAGGIPPFPDLAAVPTGGSINFGHVVLARRLPPELGNAPGGRGLDDREW